MKDRFKFRVWNSKTKRYIEPCSLVLCMDASLMTIEERSVGDEYIIEQCTGLKDKNGKLIFEGDIVASPMEYTEKHEEPITFDSEQCCFWWGGYCMSRLVDNGCEIVGNIHDK